MRNSPRWIGTVTLTACTLGLGCGGADSGGGPALRSAETFHWVRQPIAFSPPPAGWERQGDNGGGTLGVRFILRGGGGQVMSIAAYRSFAERDRRHALTRLIGRRDSLTQREFLREASLAKARTEDPLSEREMQTALEINTAIDRAVESELSDQPGFAVANLEAAARAAGSYEPTLDELLPRLRLQPHRMQEPDRWRLGRSRDTVWAGLPAFASDDTLIAPEQVLLYHQVFWVVDGCAFQAVFQGRAENLELFHRVVDSIQFPDAEDAQVR